MLQDTLNVLRRQFLGLNRVLSTVMELVSEGSSIDDEEELLRFAARLLINNHNFQFCAIHSIEGNQPRLSCALSTENVLDPNQVSEDGPWVKTCEHLARQLMERGENQLMKRQAGDTVYYAMPVTYRDQLLATLTANSPTYDDNHPKLISIYCYILTSIIINARHSRHLTEEVRSRTEELESAWRMAEASSKIKSQFLTNMSHEYLTPLNAIVGMTELLSETNLSDEQREHVNNIQESSGVLKSMVTEMLDYSLSETGELKFQSTSVELRSLLTAIFEKYKPQADSRNLEMELLIATDLPVRVIVDPIRLDQILSNLISNAIKFTETGRVTIDVYLENQTNKDAVIRFSVLDTGIGIEEEQQKDIFDVFHQIDSSNSRKYGGTGLGLSICQKVARLLGSEIELTSQPGSGSRFSFSLQLPVDVFEEEVTHLTNPSEVVMDDTTAKRLSILLVEDNLINQKLAARLLEKMGCQVDIANDGVDAVDKFSKAPYDLVFMDCQMPNMDGFEATSKIREMETDSRTPIIALTANSLPEDRARSYKVGMDEFLTKPIARDKLETAIAKWGTSTTQ